MGRTKVKIYADGSARNNPGRGGYGAIIQFMDSSGQLHEKELSCGFIETTNNRMELLGIIRALEKLNRPCDAEIYSDSQYVVNAFNKKWISGWKKRNWKTSKGTPVKNKDLWERLIKQVDKHNATFSWVKGHAGNPENERCDKLATSAADGKHLIEDPGFDGSAD